MDEDTDYVRTLPKKPCPVQGCPYAYGEPATMRLHLQQMHLGYVSPMEWLDTTKTIGKLRNKQGDS